jgi:hypothetical protein
MKPLTAKERTLSMFAGGTYGEAQENRAPRIVEDGPRVMRIALSPRLVNAPAVHLRHPAEQKTLCGLSVVNSTVENDAVGLGHCQACRAEASRLRARVGR